MQTTLSPSIQSSAERRFYLSFSIAMIIAVLIGFSRTLFLRHWFPEWAAVHGAREPFFYFHGAVFCAWLLLLLIQVSLVTARRVDIHRRLGLIGAGLAVVVVTVGTIAALIAAHRPTGFIDVPISPKKFLVVPLADLALFGSFAALGIVKRRKLQSHKRFMLLATIGILDAAVTRWPFAIMSASLPFPGFTMTDIFVDLFLVPIVIWDVISRGRVHPVTLWGGLAIIASQPLRMLLSETATWNAFAGWAIDLFGRLQ